MAICMFSYVTDIEKVQINPEVKYEFEVQGENWEYTTTIEYQTGSPIQHKIGSTCNTGCNNKERVQCEGLLRAHLV